MSAVAVIEAPGHLAPQDEWLNRGRQIAHRKVALEWDMADWIVEGQAAGYIQQGFDFLGQQLGIAPPRLKAACKAAKEFPPALRDSSVSVEHHAAVASLPKDEALPLLRRAAREHLTVNDCREVVTQHRYQTGQNFEDDDQDSTLATLQIRAWNRATPAARRMAFEHFQIAAANGFSIIDEDEVADAEE
jgi:hypothetical protein